jgi:hypothetical protein
MRLVSKVLSKHNDRLHGNRSHVRELLRISSFLFDAEDERGQSTTQ